MKALRTQDSSETKTDLEKKELERELTFNAVLTGIQKVMAINELAWRRFAGAAAPKWFVIFSSILQYYKSHSDEILSGSPTPDWDAAADTIPVLALVLSPAGI